MPRDTPGLSLTQSVYEQMRADLLACRLWPGDRLKISDLCQSMGVNLGAVREALSRLSSEGLVVAEPQRGFRVAPISATELRDLTEVRIDVETRCLRRSIESAGVGWETAIVAAHHGMTRLPERDPEDPSRANDAWSVHHAAFHRALVAGCDSPWLLRLRDSLYDQSERYRRLSVPLGRTKRNVGQEHREIMDAAVSRQADQACALLAEHFRTTTSILLSKNIVDGLEPSSTSRHGSDLSPK